MPTYQLSAIITGVGKLSDDEETAVNNVIPGGTVRHEPGISQLHLDWSLQADTVRQALTAGFEILDGCAAATGVWVTETTALGAIQFDAN